MGDRRMAEIKTSEGSLYVYTHWGGAEMPELAERAVARASKRWDDEPYALHIIVDQLTKTSRDSETGCGLMLSPSAEDEYNHDKPSVVIDLVKRTIRVAEYDAWKETDFPESRKEGEA